MRPIRDLLLINILFAWRKLSRSGTFFSERNSTYGGFMITIRPHADMKKIMKILKWYDLWTTVVMPKNSAALIRKEIFKVLKYTTLISLTSLQSYETTTLCSFSTMLFAIHQCIIFSQNHSRWKSYYVPRPVGMGSIHFGIINKCLFPPHCCHLFFLCK